MKTITTITLTLLLTACSYRGVYDELTRSAQHDCRKLPPAEYDECIESKNTSYEEYEINRQEALED